MAADERALALFRLIPSAFRLLRCGAVRLEPLLPFIPLPLFFNQSFPSAARLTQGYVRLLRAYARAAGLLIFLIRRLAEAAMNIQQDTCPVPRYGASLLTSGRGKARGPAVLVRCIPLRQAYPPPMCARCMECGGILFNFLIVCFVEAGLLARTYTPTRQEQARGENSARLQARARQKLSPPKSNFLRLLLPFYSFRTYVGQAHK